jgi:hypothetical protein
MVPDDHLMLAQGTIRQRPHFSKAVAPAVKQDLQRFWTDEILSEYLVHFTIPPGTKSGQTWQLAVRQELNPQGKVAAAYPKRLPGFPEKRALRNKHTCIGRWRHLACPTQGVDWMHPVLKSAYCFSGYNVTWT